MFTLIRTYLAEQGLQISRGTIVDATIISAPTAGILPHGPPEIHPIQSGRTLHIRSSVGGSAKMGIKQTFLNRLAVILLAALGIAKSMVSDSIQ